MQKKLNVGMAETAALSQDHVISSQPLSGNFHIWVRASAKFTGESKRQRCSYPGLKPGGVGGKSHTGLNVLCNIPVSGEEQSTL